MEKTITYVITGVWYTGDVKHSKHISHVMLHKRDPDKREIHFGEVKTKDEAIVLVKDLKKTNNAMSTAKWNYETVGWIVSEKAIISHKTIDNNEYLFTLADDTTSDNLSHLTHMNVFPVVKK